MIKKLLGNFILLFLLIGCTGLEYEGDKRIVYNGRLTDAQNNSLPGIRMSIIVQKGSSGFGIIFPASSSESETISYTTTDADGNYTMIFPAPENEDSISLLINRDEENNLIHPLYSGITILNIEKPVADTNFTVDFGTYSLYAPENSTSLNVSINGDIRNITPVGLVNNHVVDFGNPVHNYHQPVSSGNGMWTYVFTVAKNQELLVRYTIGNYEPGDVYEEVTIPVNNDPVTFIIE